MQDFINQITLNGHYICCFVVKCDFFEHKYVYYCYGCRCTITGHIYILLFNQTDIETIEEQLDKHQKVRHQDNMSV